MVEHPALVVLTQRPQLPRLPHLPGTDQGAGSLANLSSCGYCGACCALAAASDSKNTPAAAPPATRIDVRRFMASHSLERCRRPISRALEHDRNTLEHYHSARGRYISPEAQLVGSISCRARRLPYASRCRRC